MELFSRTDTNIHWSLAICFGVIQWKLFDPITAEDIAYGPRSDIWWGVLSQDLVKSLSREIGSLNRRNRLQCYRCTCQISERSYISKYKSRDVDAL